MRSANASSNAFSSGVSTKGAEGNEVEQDTVTSGSKAVEPAATPERNTLLRLMECWFSASATPMLTVGTMPCKGRRT